jgi:hypothetical protein
MSNSRSQINSNFYQIANTDATCGNITGINVGNVWATGNISAAYYFGNGSALTGVVSSINYSNANVAAFLPTYTGNLAASSDIIALYANAVAQENEITALQAAQYSNANVAAYLPTYTGNLAASSDIIALYANAAAQQNEITALQAAQYSNANVANYLQVLTSNVTTTANVSASYVLGNGAFLTGLPDGYSNADVANYLPTYTGNLALSSDIIALYANAAAQSNAIANLQSAQYSNANVANYLQVLTSNVTTTANISGTYILGNGAFLTGLPEAYSNANVANYLQVLTSNVTTTANVQAAYVIGNIRNTTGGYDDANVAAYLPTYTGNLQAGNLLVINSAVIQGNLQVLGNTTIIDANSLTIADKDITVANGATTASQANGAGLIVGAGNLANIIFNNPANAWTLYPGIDTPGNITGAYLLANITQATGYYVYGNANVAAFLPTYTGNLAASSDIIALYANAVSQSQEIANVTANVTQLQGNVININSNIANLTANVTVLQGNVVDINSNIANLTANVTVLQGNVVDINSNIANLYANAATQSNAIANLQAAQYSNANVANYLPTYTGNISAGNITVTNDIFANYITATVDLYTGNLTASEDIGANNFIGGNINVNETIIGNNAVITSNVTAALYLGNGYFLTDIQASNITGAYSNANVQAYLPTYTGNLALSSDIIALYANAATQSNAIANLQALQYSNANVSNFLANGFGSNTITTTGNIQAGTLKGTNFQAVTSAGGTLKNASGVTQASWGAGGGDNFSVSVSTNLDGANAQIDISPTGTGHVHIKPTGTGAVEIAPVNTGSVNNMVIGNVTPAAANVTTLGATGNITASYFLGNGSQLTGLPETYGNANVAAYLASNSNVVITTTGNITTAANVVTNTVIGPANSNTTITTNGFVWTFATNGNLVLPSNATQQIQYANGTFVPIGYGNANVAAYLPTYTGALPALTGNVITTANVSGTYILGNGAFLTGIPASYSNVNVAAYLPTYTGNLALSSDIIALYANAAQQGNSIIDINSNITVLFANAATQSNAIANLQAAQYSNANVANYLQVLTSNVTTTANVQASYFIGNGSQLTGLPAGYSNANVANYLAVLTSNVTTTANVQADYFIGNGAFLTGIAAGSSYSNANVANYLQVLSSNVTTTANVQANYFIGNGSQLSDVQIALQPAVVDFTFTGATSNGAVTDEFVSYAFSSDYLNGNGVQGNTWTEYTTAAGDKIAVSDTGVYITDNEYSVNGGTTWATLGSSPATIFGITFGNVAGTPTWVRVTSTGVIQYNTNANGLPTGSWTQAAAVGSLLYPVAYGNGTFLAGGTSAAYRSANGTGGWTASTGTAPGRLRGLLWDGARWLAVGADGVYYSTDNGATWTAVGSPVNAPGFAGGINYNGTTNGIYRISGGAAATLYWCNGNPTVAANWTAQTSVANISAADGQMAYIDGLWYVTGAGIWRSTSGNANIWIADTLTGSRGATVTGIRQGPNAVVTSTTAEVYRIPFNVKGVYNIGLPADPTYGANTIQFAPSASANANVAAQELGNLITANRPAYTASYANSRVTVIDTNSGGDITGAFTIATVTAPSNGTITLSVTDGANAVQDTITFTDPVSSATFQYSPAFNSNISNIVTGIANTETLPDWTASAFDSDTVRFTAVIPGFLPTNSLVSANITNGLSNGVVTTLAVSRTVETPGYSGTTVPGGTNGQLQYNANGSFEGTAGIVYDAATSLLDIGSFLERATVNASALTGNINYDIITQSILYYTANAAGNANVNFRGNATMTFNNALSTGDTIAVRLLNTTGNTAYLPVNYTIDGVTITPRWINNTAPVSANANSVMQYSYTIVKTAANTYTVLAQDQRFA